MAFILLSQLYLAFPFIMFLVADNLVNDYKWCTTSVDAVCVD